MVDKLWRYVKPFSYNTSVSRTDGRTDGRTELLYQYRASAAVCWRAIKIGKHFDLINAKRTSSDVLHDVTKIAGMEFISKQRQIIRQRAVNVTIESLPVVFTKSSPTTLYMRLYFASPACANNALSKARFPLPELTARVNGPSWRVTGFDYPSTRAVLTGTRFPLAEMTARVDDPCWWVVETGHPSTRAVNSGRQLG